MKSEKKKFNYGWLILVLLSLGIALPNYAQYQISAFGASIMKNLNLSATQFSTIATAPLLPGIFLSLVSGLLVDKFGARRILTGSVIITCCAAILRVFSSGFLSLYISMIFIGVCATFLNSNTPKILGQWFDTEKMAVGMGFFLAAANIGIALGTGTASLYSGMKGAFTGSAIFAGIVLVMWILLMREKPCAVIEEKNEKISLAEGLKYVAKSKTVWMVAMTLFLSAGSMTSMSNFLPAALGELGFAESTARVVTMALTLGALIGCFISPYLFRYFKSQKVFFAVFGAVAALGFLFAWRVSTNPVVTFILLFITGIGSNGFAPMIISMPVQDPKIGTKYGGTAGGFVATVQLGASVVIPSYIIAPISQYADGTPNYVLMFSLFALMMVLFIVFSMFLPDKKKAAAGK